MWLVLKLLVWFVAGGVGGVLEVGIVRGQDGIGLWWLVLRGSVVGS